MKELQYTDEQLMILNEYGIDLSDIVNPSFRSYNAGEFLTDDGEKAENLFFLVSGSVRTLIPAKGHTGFVLGSYLNRGIFDDTVLFRKDGRNHIRSVCESDVEVFALPLAINARILKEQIPFLHKLSEIYSVFIDQVMNSFYFQRFPFEYLLCSYIAVKRTSAEWVPDFKKVARDLDSTPRNVERCLELLVNKGVLDKGEKGYLITDPIRFEEYNKGLYKPKRKR